MTRVLEPTTNRPAMSFVPRSGASSPDILWLDDPASRDPSITGGKVAQLARLAARYPVPAGFSITAPAYAAHHDPTDATRMPESLRDAIADAYLRLATIAGTPDPAVAVRSSAVDEDGRQASFAGQHETFLNVSGMDAVVAAVGRCWASAHASHVRVYRRQQGLTVDDVRIAVLVQLLVRSDVSVVAFSANPVTARRDQIMVTASWGLGESIVGGTVTPDTWVVDARTGAISETHIGDKRRMTVMSPDGSAEIDVPRIMRALPSLSDEQVRQVATLCSLLQAESGWPVDVEAAFAGGWLYLLQCRPITTFGLDEDEPAA